MRFVIVGAGAVGGVVGARLALAGREVLLVARGAHGEAIAAGGLRLESPDGVSTVTPPVVFAVRDWQPRRDDVVLIAVKSQHTTGVLDDIAESAARAGHDATIACLQNGVENERAALRRFSRVYAVTVMCPTEHLVPGTVRAYSAPIPGILDVGRWPSGSDEVAARIAEGFRDAGFVADAVPDASRWKYRKLIMNLGNALEALCGPAARAGRLADLVKAEGEACLAAAGIDVTSEAEDQARRGDRLAMRPVGGERRGGGSSWQSLRRRHGSIEADYLNGEIVLLGRLHGVPTPANALLQRLANQAAATGAAPGGCSSDELLALLDAPASSVPLSRG